MLKQLDRARDSPLQVRRCVFRQLQKELHPDKNSGNVEAANSAFQRLMDNRKGFLAEHAP